MCEPRPRTKKYNNKIKKMWRFKSIIDYLINSQKIIPKNTGSILLYLYWNEDLLILSSFEIYLLNYDFAELF